MKRVARLGHLALFVSSILGAAACNSLSGVSDFRDVARCTGTQCGACPSGQEGCGDVCCASGERCGDATAKTCVPSCDAGQAACGLTCCAPGQFCVGSTKDELRCSACERATDECGVSCCMPGETCANLARGVCSSTWPAAKVAQSCTGSRACAGKDCCESIPLAGGAFPMGRAGAGPDACPSAAFCSDFELPEHDVTLSPFSLDTFEVTVGRFRRFLDAWSYDPPPSGAGAHPAIAGSGWQATYDARLLSTRAAMDEALVLGCPGPRGYQTWSPKPGLYESRPINCVTWHEAFVFCLWDGGRLPTEAEWEYAAANGPRGTLYPWGDAPPRRDLAAFGCGFDGMPECTTSDLPAVGGVAGDHNDRGHRDLAGSLSEWTLDVFDRYTTPTGSDPANALPKGVRSVRGGTFVEDASYLRSASRNPGLPALRSQVTGIRCARSP